MAGVGFDAVHTSRSDLTNQKDASVHIADDPAARHPISTAPAALAEPSERDRGDLELVVEGLVEEIDWISTSVAELQRQNGPSTASVGRLITRLLHTRLLYWLARSPLFSKRRQARFLKSAEKRDPLLLAARVDAFCHDFYARLGANRVIRDYRGSSSLDGALRVTAVVPNYNHAAFLPRRLESILNQTYQFVDIVILDDCSTDNSREIIDDYVARYPDRIRAIYNDTNSGSVFAQWQKGHEAASGDVVWICESDDFCDERFVANAIGSFRDPSVMMAFGRIEFADADGKVVPGMDLYREESEPGIWKRPLTRPAASWFRGGFGVKNVIANVGGSLWRRFPIDEALWAEARTYRVIGDWFLYAAIASGGQIAYCPGAVAYFCMHGGNTSGKKAQSSPDYYREFSRLMTAIKGRWDIPDTTLERFLESCRSLHRSRRVAVPFEDLLPAAELRAVERHTPHILVGLLGFSYGGGEIFPIHLANALRGLGVQVSVLQMMNAEDHPDVRAMLHPAIPVYGANVLRDMGVRAFLQAAGVSLVHSHFASVERLVLDEGGADIPFVTTLHGSYEAIDLSRKRVQRWAEKIDRFAYTADRNLLPFEGLPGRENQFVKMSNAMPVDRSPYGKTRSELGFDDDTVIFTLVARGIERKGWTETVAALRLLRQRVPTAKVGVLAVGEGPQTDRARELAEADAGIRFLGFVKEINGVYALSDVALLPTRFAGESYPLCLIQAMQMGIPCVATDIGNIGSMIASDSGPAGELIPYVEDDADYVGALAGAMERLLDPQHRAQLASNARTAARKYDIDALAARYRELYLQVIADRR